MLECYQNSARFDGFESSNLLILKLPNIIYIKHCLYMSIYDPNKNKLHSNLMNEMSKHFFIFW